MKKCSKCKETKPTAEFRKRKTSNDGLNSWCKSCADESTRKYLSTQEGRDTRRSTRLMSMYGINLEQYNVMLVAQGGKCGICGRLPRKFTLCVDHNHKTGKIRGLLCRRCNKGLGMFSDSLEGITKAMRYLENAERP